MAIDKIEFMTLDTLPIATTPEAQVQLNMLKQLALHPGIFRLAFFTCVQIYDCTQSTH